MTSLVLGYLILESLTPSVNGPLEELKIGRQTRGTTGAIERASGSAKKYGHRTQ
jgi:hypothetical protein